MNNHHVFPNWTFMKTTEFVDNVPQFFFSFRYLEWKFQLHDWEQTEKNE